MHDSYRARRRKGERSDRVADKSFDETEDIFRCLDAGSGRECWSLRYPAKGSMDFTNTPRATPVIDNEYAYLLGAFGDLHCVDALTGKIIWKLNMAERYKTKPPAWGWSSAPLIYKSMLIINPDAPEASLVALDKLTGKEIWRTP